MSKKIIKTNYCLTNVKICQYFTRTKQSGEETFIGNEGHVGWWIDDNGVCACNEKARKQARTVARGLA